MKTINVLQGSPEWAAVRAKYRCASEAPAMMGASSYLSRTELLRQKHSGLAEDIDPAKQRLFDAGHETEALARPLVEDLIADELFPATGTDDAGYLLASFDGITMDGTTGYEHKLWNESLAAQVRAGELAPMYYWQLEQQILVGGLERVIFVCSDGTPQKFVNMEYRPVPGRAEQLMAGWKQFDADLETYQPVEVIPAAVATPVIALPAVSIRVDGAVALISNLPAFGEALNAFISKIPEKPSTDQEFADCKEACKRLQDAQDALDAAEASALAQVATFDEMRRTKALYWELARTTRLAVEKLVTAREQTVKTGIVQSGKDALAAHVANLNKRLGKPYMPLIEYDFVGAAKGKRTISSLQNAVDTELARAKIEANAVADRIEINLNALREAKDHAFLFADAGQIVLKANDDFAALVKARITDHKAAEEKRLEAEREKIRAEEAAKLKAEQDRLALEARQREEKEAQAERERLLKIEQDRLDAELREAERKTAAPGAVMPLVGPLTRPEAPTGSQQEAVTKPPVAAAPPKPGANLADSQPCAEPIGGGVSPETFDLLAHLRHQREWSARTFGPGERTAGVLDHIRKELDEIAANPIDLWEWIDVVILALDGAWRIGATPEQIVAALVAKQAKNESRQWPDWRTAEPGKAIQHIKTKRRAAGARK